MADAGHSCSDLFADAVTMFAVHGTPRVERGCTLAIAALLTSAGVAMVWTSGSTLLASNPAAAAVAPAAVLGAAPLCVALIAIASKESLFRLTRQVGIRVRSPILLANAKHHRADAMSSMAAALGTCGVLIGLPAADTLAAATVGGMMVNMGVGVARGGSDHH